MAGGTRAEPTPWPLAALALIAFPAAVFYAWRLYVPCDDAYIHCVYARNFVEGRGLTYNGLVVEGFSSVLWVVALAGLGLTRIPIPELAEGLSTASGLLALWATYILARRVLEDRWLALLPAALLAATGDFCFYMSVGLEQVLFTAQVALSVALALWPRDGRPRVSWGFALLLACMLLTRPEGALIAALVLALMAAGGRAWGVAFKQGLLLTALMAPVLIARRLVFGYWLPNTYYVKADAGLANLPHGIAYLEGAGFRYGAVLAALVALLAWRLLQRRPLGRARPLLIVSAAWLASVAVQGGDNMVGGRMLVPVLPLVYAALVLLARDVLGSRGALAAGALLVPALVLGHRADADVRDHAEVWRKSAIIRRKAGLYLREHFPPDTVVALNPAGMIPYYSGLPTIDMLGLNDPAIAHHGKRDYSLVYGHQAGDGLYVLSRRPQVILLNSLPAPVPSHCISDQELWASPEFHAAYAVERWPGIGDAFIRK
ncbi:MAG TPA: hypothetical protein VFD43_08395 [Planctomycetota bacterium]|nr:hypothetical protein [Planctomycetota bacterium]